MRALHIKDTLRMRGTSANLWGRAAGLLLTVVVLVALSVGLASWARTSRQRTELIISLAARQGLLIDQIVSNAQELREDREDAQAHIASLQGAAATFEETLWVLTEGGQVPLVPGQPLDVPPATSADIQGQLHEVHHTWDTLRGYLDTILAEELDSPGLTGAIDAVERLSPQLLQETEVLIRLYEAAALEEAARLRWIQGVLLVGTAGLFLLGFLATQTLILRPLRRLGTVADRISRGDLDTPVEVTGSREIEAMAHSLETMRAQLKSSQDRLVDRASKLESRVAQHRHELEAAYELSRNALTNLDIDQLAAAVTQQALLLLEAEGAWLCLVAASGESLVWAAEREMGTGSVRHERPAGSRLVIQVMGTREVEARGETCAGCKAAADSEEAWCASAPLRTGEHAFGTLCACRFSGGAFDVDEVRALKLLANSAAIAIANASLLESERQYAQQVASLSERELLAAELHDDLAQTLSFLNLKADGLRTLLAAGQSAEAGNELAKMQEGLDRAYAQVRASLIDLRQWNLPGGDSADQAASAMALSDELADCLAAYHDASGLRGELLIADRSALELPAATQKQVVHIVREALTNAWQHAHAQRVRVRVEYIEDQHEARFVIEDDGPGFDPATVASDKHLGLTVMRARAERSGGRLVVDSQPGAGTRIIALFPLTEQTEEIIK